MTTKSQPAAACGIDLNKCQLNSRCQDRPHGGPEQAGQSLQEQPCSTQGALLSDALGEKLQEHLKSKLDGKDAVNHLPR